MGCGAQPCHPMPPPDPDPSPDKKRLIPKHAIGRASPEAGGAVYVVRLRSPFWVVRVDLEAQGGGVRFAVHPADYAETLKPAKVSHTLQTLARVYAAHAHLQDVPQWRAGPMRPEDLPPILLLDNPSSAFSGILQTEAPRLWEIDSTELHSHTDTVPAVSIDWLGDFSGPAPRFPEDTRAVHAFYNAFYAAL